MCPERWAALSMASEEQLRVHSSFRALVALRFLSPPAALEFPRRDSRGSGCWFCVLYKLLGVLPGPAEIICVQQTQDQSRIQLSRRQNQHAQRLPNDWRWANLSLRVFSWCSQETQPSLHLQLPDTHTQLSQLECVYKNGEGGYF